MTQEQQAFPRLNTPFVDKSGVIGIPWYRLLISLWNRTGGAVGGGNVSTGMMLPWAGAVADVPSGWVLCDGTAVSVTAFSDLFGVIGRTYGPGDGASTFNLPNGTNRMLIGAGGLYALGAVGGSATTTLATTNLPAHSHTVVDPGHTHTQDAHSHLQQVVNNNTGGVAGTQGGSAVNTTSVGSTDTTVATNQTAVTGVTTSNTGDGTPFASLPPYLAINWIIKT